MCHRCQQSEVELLEKGNFGEVYNMGSEEPVTIYALARIIGEMMWNRNVDIWVDPSRKRPWEIWSLLSDNTKLYKVIDARPTVSLREALRMTIAYFHENGDKWDW